MRNKDAPKIIFLTPEKLDKNKKVQNQISELYNWNLINRFVIDEAHCVSKWGHDFRKDYLKLNVLRKYFPKVPILALTATAPNDVRVDIIDLLGMKNVLYF